MDKTKLLESLDWLLMMQIINYEEYNAILLKSLPFVE